MNRTNAIVIVAIAVLVVGAGILFATHKSSLPTASSSPAASTSSAASPSSAASASPASASPAESADTTLNYTSSGFSPSSVTVTAGHKLIVKNDSSATIQVDSNPHPQHTDDTQLNIGTISPGATGSVTLTRTGSWGIHNHLDPTMMGTVVVK